MVTPRRTCLIRVPTLQALQQVVHRAIVDVGNTRGADSAVLVPSRAAAVQLRRTLAGGGPTNARVSLVPLLTREEWHQQLHARLDGAPQLLSTVEREGLMHAGARDADAAGAAPPFRLRPGLIGAMLAFYDELRRNGRSVETFERLMVEDLDASAVADRGARRLLRQTRFLAAAFRAYDERVEAAGRFDEHRLRQRLLDAEVERPLTDLLVTVADSVAQPAGLHPADFDLLARLPGLARVTLIATDAVLDCGYAERLDTLLPGIDHDRPAVDVKRPTLVIPPESDARSHFVWRDREEELREVARAVARAEGPARAVARAEGPARAVARAEGPARAVARAEGPRRECRHARTAVVVARPLPYLYLAASVFAEHGVPLETHDSLPLATEPFAAAVDLVLAFVGANFDRASTCALLRSPHFVFVAGEDPLGPPDVRALERRLEVHRYGGGLESLRRLATAWSARPRQAHGHQSDAGAAVSCAIELADELAPLGDPAPGSRLLEVLLSFLDRHAGPSPAGDVGARETAARLAIRTGLERLQRAGRALGDAEPPTDLAGLTALVHRWIEGQTAPARAGARGVQLLDTEAAPYGRFDAVFLVGLVDGEWPNRPGRSIFYPPGMLADLGWPQPRARLRAFRAGFLDLINLARGRVQLSTFALEDDAVVTASTFLDDEAEVGFDREVTDIEAIDPAAVDVPQPGSSGVASQWLAVRLGRQARDADFHGFVGAAARGPYAVSSLERYLECPFKYFARRTLALEEEAEDERTLTPQQRGLFLHRVFEAFFVRWQADGEGAITLANLEPALARFHDVADAELDRLPSSDRPVARTWLLGSAAAPGLAERLFMTEVEDPAEVIERLLEFRIDGEYELSDGKRRRRIALRGTADRIDLHADGSFHVIDYKANRPPHPARALQLPIYARCAEQRLSAGRDGEWRATHASYVAFGDPRLRVSVPGGDMTGAMRDGERRLVDAVQSIEHGDFPPRPAEIFRCQFCAYPTVCRKDYVGVE